MTRPALSVASLHAGLTALLLLGLAVAARADEGPHRVVAAGGSAAEIVFALGAGDRLIARDTTSSHPPQVLDLPDVGYVRRLSPENIIALSPDLIIAEHDAGPPEAMDLLRGAGVPVALLPAAQDPAGLVAKIGTAAQALGLPDAGAALSAQVTARLAEARTAADALPMKPRVLFILSMQGGRLLVSGGDTAADAMIGLSGGQNAVTEFTGYKPLTDESAIAAAPDIILMMDRGGEHDASLAEVAAHPALALTPAGAGARVIRMDGLYLLGFGPRTGDALLDLTAQFRRLMPEGRG
ncbi:MAG: ABC transporter substrate-binding protein [Paracoccaceae bacterium]|nr:MAG: ABC transporter substrate-binding protein [Paracoccaceae bacterium]